LELEVNKKLLEQLKAKRDKIAETSPYVYEHAQEETHKARKVYKRMKAQMLKREQAEAIKQENEAIWDDFSSQ
jgi:hypothetical protein